jgi:Gpi18-like mannosyltransferase
VKAIKIILLLFVVSRLIMFGFLSIGQPDQIHYADNQLQLDNPVLDHFIIYDSYNYAQIAMEGYTEDRLTVFFPLFPLLVRGFTAVSGMDVYWVGFVLSNFFFVCSLWLLYNLMEKKGLSERVRILTLSVLAFFPSSYFFSAFYTESFFLFLALLAFRFWGKEKRGAAYFIGGLAALTRIVGVWIPLAFFAERLIHRKLDVKDFAYAFVSSLMFAVYPVYLWLNKGDPLLFLKIQADYYKRISTIPFLPIYQDVVSAIEKLKETNWIEIIILFHLILFMIFIGYLIVTFHTHRIGRVVIWSEFIYTSGLIVMSLSSIVIRTLDIASHGFMRYFLAIFPLFIILGQRLDQALIRADKSSGHPFAIVWKSVNYLTLFIWISISVYIFLILRIKGFVA